jgi:hypothetical protein
MGTKDETVELRITSSVGKLTVMKMVRLVGQAIELQGRLWRLIVESVSPDACEMLYVYSGLHLLSTSLGDMLKPGSNQMLVSLESQLEGLEEDITKASAMLAVAGVLGNQVGLGRAVRSSVHVRSQVGKLRRGRGLAKRKRDAEGG